MGTAFSLLRDQPVLLRPRAKVTLLRARTALTRLQALHHAATGHAESKLTAAQADRRYQTALVALSAHQLILSPARRSAFAASLARQIEASGLDGLEGILLTSTLEQLEARGPQMSEMLAVWRKHQLPAQLGAAATIALVVSPASAEVFALERKAVGAAIELLLGASPQAGEVIAELRKLASRAPADQAVCRRVPHALAMIVGGAVMAARAGRLLSHSGHRPMARADESTGSDPISQASSIDTGALGQGFAATFTQGALSSGEASSVITTADSTAQTISLDNGTPELSGTTLDDSVSDTVTATDTNGSSSTSVEYAGSTPSLVSTETLVDNSDPQNPGVGSVSYQSDGSSQISFTYANGSTQVTTYGTSGSIMGSTQYDATTGTTYVYDAEGNLLSQSTNVSSSSWTGTDADGNVVMQGTTSTDAQGNTTRTYSDNTGYAAIQVSDPDGDVIVSVTAETNPDGSVTITTTTPDGSISTTTDTEGNTTTTITDSDGNVYVSVPPSDPPPDDNGDGDQFVAGDYDDWNRGDTSGGRLSVTVNSGDPVDMPSSSNDGGALNWALVDRGEGPLSGDVTPQETASVLNTNLLNNFASDSDPRGQTDTGGGFHPPIGTAVQFPVLSDASQAATSMSPSGGGFKVNDLPRFAASGVVSLGFVGGLGAFPALAGDTIEDMNSSLAFTSPG